MTVFKEFAPAKINLTLEVLGKRPDGYHELKSLVAFADVGDWITLDISKPVGVTMSGPFAGSIAGANLVEVVLRRLEIEAPQLRLGAVHLEKNLPVAAGIGGGSADAAAVIRAVQRANPEYAADIDWKAFALRIGADVPVCLVSHLSWMRGIGEIVAPLKFSEPVRIDAIVVNPLVAMPEDKTAQVFRAYAAEPNPYAGRPESHPGIHNRKELLKVIGPGWKNDLQFAAWKTFPVIDEVMQAMGAVMKPGGRFARMSGAGPTIFAIFDDAANAASAAAVLQRAQPSWWVKAVTLG
jgi:4-diphosphocytidyl-2-C-methyl-D-erythritol kinase